MVAVTLNATFAANGSYTWTCPSGVTSVVAACTGAGAGGGAVNATSGANGGGGGGGEAALESALAVTPGNVYQLTVGAGGAGGTAAGTAAVAGGDTFFTGDSVTVYAHGAAAGGTAVAGDGAGGAGGGGSTNLVSASGGDGDDGTVSANGGGGGGAGGVSAAFGFPGNPAVGQTAGAASGGTWPGGAGGAGRTTGTSAGIPGSAPGGGGGGALSTGTGRAGGAGADGQVVITWTQNDPVTLSANTNGGTYKFTAPAGATSVTAQAWGAGGGGFNTPAGTSGGGVAGSTVWQVYGSTNQTNRVTVANTFDGYAGVPMALQAQKVYYNETGGDSIAQYVDINHPQQIGNLAAAGCQIVLCPKPNRNYTVTDDFTALQSAVTDIVSHIGASNLTVVLWQECTDNWFPSAAAYLAYWNHYAPAIPSNVKLALDLGAGPGLATDQAFGQAIMGSSVRPPDVIAVDVYDSSYSHGRNYLTYPSSDPNYPGVADMADTLGVPFGIYEWGQSASASYPATDPDPGWHDYIYGTHGLLTVIQARIAAGSPMHHVMYYGGAGPGNNDIESSTDFRIQAMVDIYNAMAGAQAAGGAGGGGGEYAAESSLAIVDGHSYALVVGDGVMKASGGNTTIAGQSVTVTAHGGSVAATTGTGGAAGTGSSNTTHHDGGAGGNGGVVAGAGGGGGSSGGTSASGNAGGNGGSQFGGAGGAAPAGGGMGGFGAKPSVNGGAGQSPGGGGGGGGASAQFVGTGADGQITLSSFVTNPGGPGSYSLAPLAWGGTGNVNTSSYALAPLAFSAVGFVGGFTHIQDGPAEAGSPSFAAQLTAPSTAGTLLIAVLTNTNQQAFAAPAGWLSAAVKNTGGASGRLEVWYYPSNPGGITSATFSTSSGTNCRGYMIEFSTPLNTTQVLDKTGTASGTTGTTSFPVSTSGSAAAADLAFAAFADDFSVTPSGQSYTTPSGWILSRNVPNVVDNYAGYYKTGVTAGTQSVTGTFSTSTNQIGWAAAIATFTTLGYNSCSGSFALAPLAFSGSGTAVIPAGTVVSSGSFALAPLAFQSPSLAQTFPKTPLPIMVEILINGVWTDITTYVYQRDGISISGRGRPDEATFAQPAQVTLTLNNRDGSFSPQNSNGQYFPYLVRNTQIRISVQGAVTPQGANYTGYRFWGEVTSWPPLADPSGTDVYVSIPAAGVLQRMLQSRTLGSALLRYYNNQYNSGVIATFGGGVQAPQLAGYWSCEDGTSATQFASSIPGGSPMTWAGGTPALGADSSVAGSDPFAQLNGTTWTADVGAFSSGGITFTNPGMFQWTCPSGITSVKAECWGAGGGGGNGVNGASGAGGEYAAEANLAVTPGNTYTVVVGAGGSGGPGSFSTNGLGGQGGQVSTFKGDSTTVRGNGGFGAGGHAGASAAQGGHGSANSTHHSGGNGAAASGHFGGNGGGSSAGPGSAGNAGNASTGTPGANGASAVPGGGAGGDGGTGATAAQGNVATPGQMPVPGPGGGGGGGGFNGGDNYAKPGGGGQAGQVSVSFGTAVPTPNANVLRLVIDVPAAGGIDGAYLGQILTAGTVADLHFKYHTGGNLELRGNDIHGTQLFTSGSQAFSANGQPLLISGEMTQKSATTIAWKMTAITPNAATVVATFKGTVSGTLGSVTQVNVNNNVNLDTGSTGVGHIAVLYQADNVLNLAPAFAAYAGELAATRFLRLCGEQNVPAMLQGAVTDTPQMGPQPNDLLVNLLQDCENTDLGQMFEPRDQFGLAYRTRINLQNQTPDATLDYSLGQLAQGLAPTDDELLIRNDVVATRTNGSTFEASLTTGALSINDPPNGVGLYSYPVTVNVFQDSQLANFAAWVLIVGTVDEYRYPVITIDMTRTEVSDGTFGTVATLDIGDYLQVVNTPFWISGPVNQLCFGFTETLNAFVWTIAINAVPCDPYLSTGGVQLPTW